jgi:endonuclease V-like protein UPF0215 family
MLKPEIRILGFDDGPFKEKKGRVPVIGVIYRGGSFLDGILRTDVKIDGIDATAKLVKLINSSRHKQQLKVIMLDGITFGGFNVVDVKELHEKTGLPIIVVNRKHPDLKKVQKALKKFRDFERRWQMIKNAGKIKSFQLKNGAKVFYQCIGLSDEEAEEIIELSSTHAQIPEALRVAHLIATAIVKGESFGRA